MKDEMQNLTDLIGALAEDIEEIKTIVKLKDTSGKDEALKKLEVKLEPVFRFFGGSSPENINGIFRSKESIAAYRKSQGEETAASLLAKMDANEQDKLRHGIPTRYGILLDIRNMLAGHIEESRRISGNSQKSRPQTRGFLFSQKCNAISKRIISLWRKIPDGWYKNPYIWAAIVCTLVFFALFAVSWAQWHEYREENRRLRTVADKHKVTTVMLNELYPELAVPVGAYENLLETVGVDSTLAVFYRQLEKVRNEENKTDN